MSEYATQPRAAKHLAQLALRPTDLEEAERQIRALHAAYRWLATADEGRVILDNLALELLKPCQTPEDEGARRLVLRIFATIRDAMRGTDD